jgi:hypothetical protein
LIGKGQFVDLLRFKIMSQDADKVLLKAHKLFDLEKAKKKQDDNFVTPGKKGPVQVQDISPLSEGGVSSLPQAQCKVITSPASTSSSSITTILTVVPTAESGGDTAPNASSGYTIEKASTKKNATDTTTNSLVARGVFATDSCSPLVPKVIVDLLEEDTTDDDDSDVNDDFDRKPAAKESPTGEEEASSDEESTFLHSRFEKPVAHKSCRPCKLRHGTVPPASNKSKKTKSGSKEVSCKSKKGGKWYRKVTLDMFARSEEKGFRVNGQLTLPSQQGYQLSSSTLFCGPCGKPVVWDARQKHTVSTKHIKNLAGWAKKKKTEQLRLTHHQEWQQANNLQGQTIPELCRGFRLDAMRVACQANVPTGALLALEDFLSKHCSHRLGGERGLTDNIPFLW